MSSVKRSRFPKRGMQPAPIASFLPRFEPFNHDFKQTAACETNNSLPYKVMEPWWVIRNRDTLVLAKRRRTSIGT